MRLPKHTHGHGCLWVASVCGCQVPFHAQIECLSCLVGTPSPRHPALSPSLFSPPEAETPHGYVFAVASVSRLSIHLSVLQRRQLSGWEIKLLQLPVRYPVGCLCDKQVLHSMYLYNSWRFRLIREWRTKNYYLLSTLATSSSACLCVCLRPQSDKKEGGDGGG